MLGHWDVFAVSKTCGLVEIVELGLVWDTAATPSLAADESSLEKQSLYRISADSTRSRLSSDREIDDALNWVFFDLY